MSIFNRLARLSAGVAFGLAMTAGVASAQETVNIGWTGPLSGGAALYGKNTLNGIEMAVNEINAKGGVEVGGKKYKFNVVALDDKYSPAEAAVNGRRLVQEYKTPVIFTPHFGGTAALQAFNESMGFLLGSYTSVPSVTQRGNTLTVRIPPPFDGYMEPFTKIAMDRYGPKVAIANATHDYAKAWTALFVPVWEKMGGTVVANNPMDYNKDTDFYSGVSRVLAEKPDVLFIGGASEPTALVAKQARELGFKGGFIIMDQAKLDEMAKVTGGYKMLEGGTGVVPLVDYGTPETASYVERYRKVYKDNPGSEAGLNYFATYMFVEAMKQSGSVTDAKAIRASINKALETLPAEYNIYELEQVDEGGGLMGDLTVGTVKDGKVVVVRRSELFPDE
jgi:branched-chain amino acid transport system substrate-binding protein